MRFFEVISAPLALLALSCVAGRPDPIDAHGRSGGAVGLDSWQTAADAARDERNGTGALLDAWFGCAMGDTWAGALDTPPHAWSPHNLDRCHAVGVVGGASAVRLAAMAPDAVLAVETELRKRIETDGRMPLQEREAARALFRDGTAALEEMAEVHYARVLLERASKSSAVAKSRSESSSIAWLLSDDTTPEALAGARRSLAAVGSLEALLHLAASEPKSVSTERARALAWMIGLRRMAAVTEIALDLRVGAIAPVQALLFPLDRGPDVGSPAPAWPVFVAETGARVLSDRRSRGEERCTPPDMAGWSPDDTYGAIVCVAAARLRAVTLALGPSELRRTASGYANAVLRDHLSNKESPDAKPGLVGEQEATGR